MRLVDVLVFEKHLSPVEFSRIAAYLPVGLCLYSEQKRAIYFLNDQLAQWLNHSDPLAMTIHPDDLLNLEKNIFERLNADCEIRVKNRTGDWVWLNVRTSTYSDFEMLLVLQNITLQKEEHFKSLHTAKLAALGEMSGAIAHEVNNPLAVIATKADLLKRKIVADTFTSENALQSLQEIYDMTFRISKIMKGLRQMLKKSDAEPFESVTLQTIVEDVLLLTGERFQKESIHFDVAEIPEILLSCRAVQLSQIFINLLNNAYDAVSQAKTSDRWIRLSFENTSNTLRCLVTDCGRGIDEKIRERLMQPFQTTKIANGMGLGLSISRSIAHEHGGKLSYVSKAKHTTFCLELPIAVGVFAQRPARAA